MQRNKLLLQVSIMLLCILVSVTPVHAQAKMMGGDMAKKQTDKMQEKLPITDSVTYQKVYDINAKYMEKTKEAMQDGGSKLAKFKALKSVQNEKNAEMKAVLTAEQYKKYEEMVAETKEELKAKFKERKN